MTVYGARRHRARRRRVLLGAVLGLLLVTVLAGAGHLSGGKAHPRGEEGRNSLSPVSWPAQGQAALALGNGRPAASPHEQPVPIASLAKVMTAYLTLTRYPLSGAQDGFEITVTAAQAQAEAGDAAEGQSVAPVQAGERLSERQLLEALLIPSGNNIAQMLAAEVAGSRSRFVPPDERAGPRARDGSHQLHRSQRI
jgi:D-alanyl-D-alanine carboxypeptidase (penicillin-binding protein 5/6)